MLFVSIIETSNELRPVGKNINHDERYCWYAVQFLDSKETQIEFYSNLGASLYFQEWKNHVFILSDESHTY